MRTLFSTLAFMVMFTGVSAMAGPPSVHAYFYYPSAEIYFDPGRSVYFGISGGTWIQMPRPPVGIVLGSGVNMELNTLEPYRFHGEHKKKYPPGLAKKGMSGRDWGHGGKDGKSKGRGKGHKNKN